MEPNVDIAFDCLPLRSVGRVDVPLDASPAFRARVRAVAAAIDVARHRKRLLSLQHALRVPPGQFGRREHGALLVRRHVLTDRSDCKADRADLAIELTAETCGTMPPDVLAWFRGVVERAVLIEFDHFIAAGSLAARVSDLGKVESIAALSDFAGNV